MNEKLRKKIVYAVFVLACVWAYFSFSGDKTSLRQPSRTIQSTSIQPASRPDVQPPTIKRDSLIIAYKNRPWGKNPFYHSYQADESKEKAADIRLHLLGIIYKTTGGHALINNRVVGEGDEVEGYRVVQIARDSVVLNGPDDTVTLKIKKESS